MPLDAIADELRRFPAEEVLICTYPPGVSNWLETGIVTRLHEELDICVTQVVVGRLGVGDETHRRCGRSRDVSLEIAFALTPRNVVCSGADDGPPGPTAPRDT